MLIFSWNREEAFNIDQVKGISRNMRTDQYFHGATGERHGQLKNSVDWVCAVPYKGNEHLVEGENK